LDVKWRNIGYYMNEEGERLPVLFDLDSVVEYNEEKHLRWVDNATSSLYSN
jgi:hypothetical protein